MALTIRMRIDDHDEHSYYYATGSGSEIELIPLTVNENGVFEPDEGKAYNKVTVNVPLTELETLVADTNQTYTAPSGKAYNVVEVNVQPILEAVSRSYTENGTYTIQPTEGKDGISEVTVVVDVPQDEPNLESKSVVYSLNDTYTILPDEGYDGLSDVTVEVDVPQSGGANLETLNDTIVNDGVYDYYPSTGYDGFDEVHLTVLAGGGSSNVVSGTFTPEDGASKEFSTGRTGTIFAMFIWADKTTLDNVAVASVVREFTALLSDNQGNYYKTSSARTGTSGTGLNGSASHGTMPTTASGNGITTLVGVKDNGATVVYAGRNGSTTQPSLGFYPGTTYNYYIIYQ